MEIGKPIPDIVVPTTHSGELSFASLKGKNIVLYFYPKDCTSGCTRQAQDFRDYYQDFVKLNTVIIGVSRDKASLHQRFIDNEQLPFELIPDPEQKLCALFDVIKPKNMYGKMVTGIERSTFLFDKKGILRKEWRKVKVPNHVNDVLAAITALS